MQLRNTFLSALSSQSIPVKHLAALFLALVVILAAALWPSADSKLAATEYHPLDTRSSEAATITPQIRYRNSDSASSNTPANSVDLTLTQPEHDEPPVADSVTTDSTAAIEPSPEEAAVELEVTFAIDQGDTLSTIFDQVDIGQTTMYQILSADEQLLALDILRPGNTLTFRKHPETLQLEEMELYIHAGNQIIYRRVDEQNF